ncbi:MAG: radical SAM family heme chaperone HemW [Thermoleophilia bacterium]
MDSPAHLYIHIPYCQSRCGYCDFFSTAEGIGSAARYLETVKAEIAASGLAAGSLSTVYVGGGTPSLLGEELLTGLLDFVAPLAVDGAEVTIEANPSSFNRGLAQAVAAAGVNRVSLGAQSFNPELRRRAGRAGDAGAVAGAVAAARQAGVDAVSLDLLFALPGETAAMLAADRAAAVSLEPDHVSCYELTVKQGSAFHERWHRELAAVQRLCSGQYDIVSATLEAAGYQWYETSNYSRAGRECRHNLACWRGDDYIGVGAGAWSTAGRRRWRNSESLELYMEDFTAGRLREELSSRMKAVEALMLGLRTRHGVAYGRVAAVIDSDQLALMEQNGFIASEGAKIKLTRKGRFVANEVCARLLREDADSGHSTGEGAGGPVPVAES